MRYRLIFLFITLSTSISFAQNLTINETEQYINNILRENPYGNIRPQISISKDGYLIIKTIYTEKGRQYGIVECNMKISDITIRKDSKYPQKITIFCKSEDNYGYNRPSCINCTATWASDRGGKEYDWLTTGKKDVNDKVFNALSYLFKKIETNEEYKAIDNDPFSPNNFNKKKDVITKIFTRTTIIINGIKTVNKLKVRYELEMNKNKITLTDINNPSSILSIRIGTKFKTKGGITLYNAKVGNDNSAIKIDRETLTIYNSKNNTVIKYE